MYEAYFGLNRPPFNITPDTSLFFDGGQRGDILGALVYAVHRGEGIIKVVGEVGSGKTMLCRMLQQELPENVEIVYIANPSVSPEDILFVIASELKFNVARDSSKHELVGLLQDYLLQKHEKNHQVVLFVEEAQGMPLETLEEIRLLSNLETDRHKLLQIVLFGQPELDQNLEQSSIRQLRERITHDFNLSPLNAGEIHNYLNFRMREVGYTGPELISKQLAVLMQKQSSGLLRRINILADKMLLSAFAEDTHTLTKKHLMNAVKDSGFNKLPAYPQSGGGPRRVWFALALGLLVATSVLWAYYARLLPPLDAGGYEDTTLLQVDPVPPPEEVSQVPPENTSAPSKTTVVAEVGADVDLSETHPVDTSEKLPKAIESESLVTEGSSNLVTEPAIETSEQANDTGFEQREKGTSKMPASSKKIEQAGSKLDKVSEVQPKNVAPSVEAGIDHDTWLVNKIQQSREWLRNAEGKGVTIQVLTRNAIAVEELIEFLRSEWPLDLDKTYVYEVEIRNTRFYSVFYDEFPTVSEGNLKIKQLPESVSANSPYLQSIYRMQQALL